MIYFIDYTQWVIVFSVIIFAIFILFAQKRKVISICLVLNAFLIFLPRLLPLDYVSILNFEYAEHTLEQIGTDGKVMDNMVSFSGVNYYLEDDIAEGDLEPGFYKTVNVIQTRDMLITNFLKIKVHIDTYYRNIYVPDLDGDAIDEDTGDLVDNAEDK